MAAIMATSASRTQVQPPSGRPKQPFTVRRIRFLTELPPGARVRREFKQPRHVFAVEEVVEPADLPAGKVWPEPVDQCCLVFVSNGSAKDGMENAAEWLAPPDQPEAAPTVVIELDGDSIQWRPGRALVQAHPERREDIQAALTEFSFYEGELRTLESAADAREAQAREDVARTYGVGSRDRKHWKRLRETMEYLAQLRLTYARLEPRLEKGSRTLAPEARRLMVRLLRKADVESRLEHISNRLETLEDLYEGAVDRIADYRLYRNGHWLEIIIIVLLLSEVFLMSGDMYIRYLDYKVDAKASETSATDEKTPDLSEEYRATLLKVEDGKVTFRMMPGKDGKAAELAAEQTLPVTDNVKVAKGKLDKETLEVEAGDPIHSGLKNLMFTNINDKGLRVVIVTDQTNKKVAEIYVLATSRGKQ
jgi:hypothetical protein